MFIMKYANGGDLHNYLQKNFTEITWKKKLHILWRISDGYIYHIISYNNTLIINELINSFFILDFKLFMKKTLCIEIFIVKIY